MERGFDMTHETLEASATRLRVHGAEYASAVRALTARGDGAASWGDDGLMGPLVAAYVQCKDTALAAFAHMGDVVGATGDAMGAATGRVRFVEDDVTGGLDDLGGSDVPGATWT
ncbi:hypothetical protein Skr01_15770 [Sphaerisporangium krabiense]|uniref:ESX-1 secretion-associated protein n=1 Tax=Sphaerisporangium krabiense TaxID=763782 RepID=A0A7W8YZU2_9ACTN|nr:hypothetical protein [Sphaerisporangium krabiense]MBB5624553.1 hypothetical protein [Sphaerisporangium krabiense]GII61492.1 hypothetical protein Skr01_15770 [Sphaerisporangium krabiense]